VARYQRFESSHVAVAILAVGRINNRNDNDDDDDDDVTGQSSLPEGRVHSYGSERHPVKSGLSKDRIYTSDQSG
jgi:hypothetical protein